MIVRTVSGITLAVMTVAVGSLLFCTGGEKLSGGTGAGNAAILGSVIHADGTPVEGARVRVRPDDYVQDTSRSSIPAGSGRTADCTTGADGVFEIDSLGPDSYYIEVVDAGDLEGTLFRIDYADTGRVVLAPKVVEPLTKINGSITLSGMPQHAWVQIYGIEYVGRTDENGRFVIDSLPLGKCEEHECEYTLRILAVTEDGTPYSVNYELEIEQHSTGITVEIEMGDEEEEPE